MNNIEFVAKLKDIALNYKTLYVMGCFGAPMTYSNKIRYCKNDSYNMKSARTKMIKDASLDTFGFDCVCLIKGVLWGWNGDTSKVYGGATYSSNGVPDIDTESMINVCSNISTDFNNIEVGELVWMKGHVGIYIGNGLAVECSPAWENKVQITACNKTVSGYKRRNWTKHGKLPYITYEKASAPAPVEDKHSLTVLRWQKSAIADGFTFPKYGADGEWGAECESVAKKAVCKRCYWPWKNKNLTKIIQEFLGVEADGKFGNNTKNAVITYQKRMGLAADGCVGINTWKSILGV
jgi:hypothetical protein